MRTCCPGLAAWDPLDPMLQPGVPALVSDWQASRASQLPDAARQSWSRMVDQIRLADEAAWNQAEQAVKETAPAAAGVIEFLRANKTAVYWVSGVLLALALLRRRLR